MLQSGSFGNRLGRLFRPRPHRKVSEGSIQFYRRGNVGVKGVSARSPTGPVLESTSPSVSTPIATASTVDFRQTTGVRVSARRTGTNLLLNLLCRDTDGIKPPV